MTKLSHEKKVKMARKMMSKKEKTNKQYLFNTIAWNLRKYYRQIKEYKKMFKNKSLSVPSDTEVAKLVDITTK